MNKALSPQDLHKVARFVHDHIGFSYASDRMGDLNRGFLSACQDLGYSAPDSCLKLMEDPVGSLELEKSLVKKLTIGETYFFRDKRLFQYLKNSLLPGLIEARRSGRKYLRIWCAACSSGEEPYSIAMLVKYLIPDIADWDISILATDINAGSLHAAQRGVYSRWSFREDAPIPTDPYISPSLDGRFQVSESIKKMVHFSQLNLITDLYPSTLSGTTTMDLILCRNVLMYFSNELAGEVVDRLNSCLIADGWLVVSPQEISYAQRPGFIQIKQSSVFLFKKGIESEENGKSPLFFSETSHSDIPPVRYFEPDFRKTSVTTIVSSGHNLDPESTDLLHHGIGDYNPATILTHTHTRITPDKTSESDEEMRGKNPLISIQSGHLADAEYLLMQPEYQNISQISTIEMMARIYADQGDIDRALGWCDRILGIDPLYPGAYYLRGIIEQDQGNSVAAVQSLRQALYADPDYLPAYLMLGTITGAQGKKAEARRHYQVVLKLLSGYTDDTPVDKTEGMPAGQVREMVMKLLDGMPLS